MAGLVKRKIKLPKAVLEMKFMKKSKERIEKEFENTQHGDLYANAITDKMRSASGNFITESSFIFCENLLEGRLSFKGMNPEIERLMQLETKPETGEMDKDISDEKLACKLAAFNKHKRPSSPSKYTIIKKKRTK